MTRETKLGMVVAGTFLALLGGVVGTKYFFKPAAPAPAAPGDVQASSAAQSSPAPAQLPPSEPPATAASGNPKTEPAPASPSPVIQADHRTPFPPAAVAESNAAAKPINDVDVPILSNLGTDTASNVPVINESREKKDKKKAPLAETTNETPLIVNVPETEQKVPTSIGKDDFSASRDKKEDKKKVVKEAPKIAFPVAQPMQIDIVPPPSVETVVTPAAKVVSDAGQKTEKSPADKQDRKNEALPKLDEMVTPPKLDEVVTPPKLDEVVTPPKLNEAATPPKLDKAVGPQAHPKVDAFDVPPPPDLSTPVTLKADPMAKKEQPGIIVPSDVTPRTEQPNLIVPGDNTPKKEQPNMIVPGDNPPKKEQTPPLPVLNMPKIDLPKDLPEAKEPAPLPTRNTSKTRPVVLDVDGGASKAPSALDPAIAAPKPAAPKQDNNYDEDLHSSKKNESYSSISKQYYNSEAYATALQRYNRDNPPGQADYVRVPPIWVLEKRYGSDIAGGNTPGAVARPVNYAPPATVESARVADAYYTVGDNGESLASIAKKVLGTEDAWQRLYQLNPQINPAQTLPGGTRLKLPEGGR